MSDTAILRLLRNELSLVQRKLHCLTDLIALYGTEDGAAKTPEPETPADARGLLAANPWYEPEPAPVTAGPSAVSAAPSGVGAPFHVIETAAAEVPPPAASAEGKSPAEPSAPDQLDPRRPWTDEDKADAFAMAEAGHKGAAIGLALGRDRKQVENLLSNVKRERPRKAATAATPVEPEVDTPTATAEPESQEAESVVAATTSDPDPETGFWTPERDLELATGFCNQRAKATADEMGVPWPDALRRWNELLPVKGIIEQRKLFTRLKARVDALSLKAAE